MTDPIEPANGPLICRCVQRLSGNALKMNKRTCLAAWIVPSCVLIVVVAGDLAAASRGNIAGKEKSCH